MNRRAILAAVPSIALAGCATRLGLADRVEITRKSVRLHPWNDEPIDAVVRRYDPDEGVASDADPHEAIADEIDPGEPLAVSESVADRLAAEYEIVEYRITVCALEADGDCRETTLVREDFNEVESGDVVDIVSRSSGAGVIDVHERREARD